MKPFLCVTLLSLGLAGAARAEQKPGQPYTPLQHIRPNLDVTPVGTVCGTVTVRLDGALVTPQQINYLFSVEFPGSAGEPVSIGEGTYFLKVFNVPVDQTVKMTMNVVYDSTIRGSDGVVERRGRTYTGTLRMDIPYTEDYDFGVRFIDLR